jgi:hypothetical protein
MLRLIKKTATTVALIAALAAISAPLAAARFDLNPPVSSTSPAPTQSYSSPSGQSGQVVSNGFDWGDAAIGAAGTLALLIIITGAVLAGRRGRGLEAAAR